MNAKKLIKNITIAIGVALFWAALWLFAAIAIDNQLILPTPLCVFKRLVELCATTEFWKFTALSILRVFAGIALAIPFSVIFAALCSCSAVIDKIFAPAVLLMKSTPVVSFILIAIFIVDRSVIPSLITFMMICPVLYENTREGIKQTHRDLLHMAKVFRLSGTTKLKRIYLPAVKPFFYSALCTSIGLALKAGIAAEVVAYIPDSIGKKLSDAKSFMEPADLLAWTAVIIIISLTIEFLLRFAINKLTAPRKEASK